MALRLIPRSLRRSGLLSPSLLRSVSFLRTSRQRRGAKTTRLRRPRLAHSSFAQTRPSHSAPNVRDDRDTPLLIGYGTGGACRDDLPVGARELFSKAAPHLSPKGACQPKGQSDHGHGQTPDAMRLAILRSQALRQRLPPAVKQREMQTCSEHTTACAGEISIMLDAISASAAVANDIRHSEKRRMRSSPAAGISVT